MRRLDDPVEMKLIYDYCKKVFSKELTPSIACKALKGHVSGSEASLKMYFNIYASMRKGTCYKMGTSVPFTKFLIDNINSDFGTEAMLIALSSAKQNSDYRINCDNEQVGIKETCRELIKEYKLQVQYEDLDKYKNKGVREQKEVLPEEKRVNEKTSIIKKHIGKDYLKVRITIGSIVFEAEGTPESVINQEKMFTKEILPKASVPFSEIHDISDKDKSECKRKNLINKTRKAKLLSVASVGKTIVDKHKEVALLRDKMDFKAKMIPLLYFATVDGLQSEFSVKEIQQILLDALELDGCKKQIEAVFERRPDWFEQTNTNPKRYKLLDIGNDYARNILQ